MLAKKEVSLKMSTKSYDRYDQQKIARTAYYAGEEKGTCRVEYVIKYINKSFYGITTHSRILVALNAIFLITAFWAYSLFRQQEQIIEL